MFPCYFYGFVLWEVQRCHSSLKNARAVYLCSWIRHPVHFYAFKILLHPEQEGHSSTNLLAECLRFLAWILNPAFQQNAAGIRSGGEILGEQRDLQKESTTSPWTRHVLFFIYSDYHILWISSTGQTGQPNSKAMIPQWHTQYQDDMQQNIAMPESKVKAALQKSQ